MNIRFGLFLAVAAVQLLAPLSQVWRYENVLSTGTLYKFRTAAVDPYDAFRGRYVALNFQGTSAPTLKGESFTRGQKAYALLLSGSDGFTQFKQLSAKPPKEGDYLEVDCGWDESAGTRRFSLPFDRFYMEESAAPKAEQAYRDHNRRGNAEGETYVAVRVKSGRGVIQDVFIQNRPIREFLRSGGQ